MSITRPWTQSLHDVHIPNHFPIQKGTAHGLQRFLRKTNRVTLPSYPPILLSRLCTVVTHSGFVATGTSIQECCFQQRTRSCRSMDMDVRLRNVSVVTVTLERQSTKYGNVGFVVRNVGGMPPGSFEIYTSGWSGRFSGVSLMQLVFGRNPEIPVSLFSDNHHLVANSSLLHDRDAGQAARVRTIARTKLMLRSDKLNAGRKLDTRPRVEPSFLRGDMVAVWRMTREAAILACKHITDVYLEYARARLLQNNRGQRYVQRDVRGDWRRPNCKRSS